VHSTTLSPILFLCVCVCVGGGWRMWLFFSSVFTLQSFNGPLAFFLNTCLHVHYSYISIYIYSLHRHTATSIGTIELPAHM
jgi:hypothetical protein